MKSLIKKILKEEEDHFEWTRGEVDLNGYILNFEPELSFFDIDKLIERLNGIGIYKFGNGRDLHSGFGDGRYQTKGVHFLFVEVGGVMASSGPLNGSKGYTLSDYMEEQHDWDPSHIMDGRDVLNL